MHRYRRPTNAVRLGVQPRLASWDRAADPSQVGLAHFLAHVDEVAAAARRSIGGRLAVELIVGLAVGKDLTGGGRDLDNYLHPVAQRIGPARLAAVFGRKAHGPSSSAVGPAEVAAAEAGPRFTARITGSYGRAAWKETVHSRLLEAQVSPAGPGAVAMDIAIATGPNRNWANLWKPLIDAFGPILGDDPRRRFHPHDDRVISLGLHHHQVDGIGHDVIIDVWWQNA